MVIALVLLGKNPQHKSLALYMYFCLTLYCYVTIFSKMTMGEMIFPACKGSSFPGLLLFLFTNTLVVCSYKTLMMLSKKVMDQEFYKVGNLVF